MQDNEKKPALRFKGFTDPWEQRKLEEYLEVSGQKNFEGIYTKEDVLSVSGDFGIVNTHASVLLFAGVSIASVARRLGHSSMTTTQKTYLHIIQELENQDIDLVMRSLSGLS